MQNMISEEFKNLIEKKMKKTVPSCGLLVLPKTGHTSNLEEPERFNSFVSEFIATVESGRWDKRDPRALPGQIMKTS